MIEIDGSYLEGGGQITRTAVALSAVTKKPVRIFNIRKGRTKPGLSAQHLTGIKAGAKLCNAETKGVEFGSTEIEFTANKIKGGNYRFDIGTAGSITLLLQTLIPICLNANKETTLELTGGTDVKWSMDKNFFEHIFLYYLNEKFNLRIKLETLKHGFFPKGGGKLRITINNIGDLIKDRINQGKGRINSNSEYIFNILKREKLKEINVYSISSKNLKERKVAERQLKGFEELIKPSSKFIEYVNSFSPGTSIHAHYRFENCRLGSSVIGERSMKAEHVGNKCATLLKKQIDSGACLDRWMADQILPYMALAVCNDISSPINLTKAAKIKKNIGALTEQEFNKKSSAQKCKVSVAEITKHCLTNAWIIEKFLPVKFNINKETSIIEAKRLNK